MGIPVSQDLDVYQGDTFTAYFRLRAKTDTGGSGAYIDLTGWVPKSEIRTDETSSSILATFTCTLDNQTTSPGGITLTLTPSQTATLNSGKWDLQFTNSGNVRTYIRGLVNVVKEITRG